MLTAEVDDKEIDNELNDLHGGQIFFPLPKESLKIRLSWRRDTPKSWLHQQLHSNSNLLADEQRNENQAVLGLTHYDVNKQVERDYDP